MKNLLFILSLLSSCSIFNTSQVHEIQYWFRGDVAQAKYTDGDDIVTINNPEMKPRPGSPDNALEFFVSTETSSNEIFVSITTGNNVTGSSANITVSINGMTQTFSKTVLGGNVTFSKIIEID